MLCWWCDADVTNENESDNDRAGTSAVLSLNFFGLENGCPSSKRCAHPESMPHNPTGEQEDEEVHDFADKKQVVSSVPCSSRRTVRLLALINTMAICPLFRTVVSKDLGARG
jgi:hypothetical protein